MACPTAHGRPRRWAQGNAHTARTIRVCAAGCRARAGVPKERPQGRRLNCAGPCSPPATTAASLVKATQLRDWWVLKKVKKAQEGRASAAAWTWRSRQGRGRGELLRAPGSVRGGAKHPAAWAGLGMPRGPRVAAEVRAPRVPLQLPWPPAARQRCKHPSDRCRCLPATPAQRCSARRVPAVAVHPAVRRPLHLTAAAGAAAPPSAASPGRRQWGGWGTWGPCGPARCSRAWPWPRCTPSAQPQGRHTPVSRVRDMARAGQQRLHLCLLVLALGLGLAAHFLCSAAAGQGPAWRGGRGSALARVHRREAGAVNRGQQRSFRLITMALSLPQAGGGNQVLQSSHADAGITAQGTGLLCCS